MDQGTRHVCLNLIDAVVTVFIAHEIPVSSLRRGFDAIQTFGATSRRFGETLYGTKHVCHTLRNAFGLVHLKRVVHILAGAEVNHEVVLALVFFYSGRSLAERAYCAQ